MLRRRLILGGINFWNSVINIFRNRVVADGGTFEADACLQRNLPIFGQNLYDKASLIITPNAYKAGKIYALKPNNGSGDMVFSRASSRSRRNANGLIELIGNNFPAIEHPVGGGCPAVSFEPQRTNIMHNSDLRTGWNTTSANYTAANAVLGGIDGRTLSVVGTNNGIDYNQGLRQAATLTTIPSGTTFTVSFFARKNGSTNTFGYYLVSSGLEVSGVFNVDANTRAAGYSAGVTRVRFEIKNLGNGIFRCIDVLTATTNLTYGFCTLGFATGINTHVAGMAGDFAGLQIEPGAYETSYIPALGSSTTRIADTSVLTGATSIIGQTEGVLYWEGSCDQLTDLIGINQSIVNGLYISRGAGSLYIATIIANSATISFADIGVKTNRVKIALAYKSGDSVLFVNGVQVGPTNTTTFTFSGVLSSIHLNDNYLIGQQSHLVNSIQLATSRLSNAELQALTTL